LAVFRDGGSGRTLVGQAVSSMGCEPAICSWPPPRLARVCFEHGSVVVVLPAASPPCFFELEEVVVRFIGVDVHRDFCEVAIVEDGRLRFAGQVASAPSELEVFAGSLAPDDVVAMEATANALAIARIVEPHVARVVLADPKSVKRITACGPRPTRSTRRCWLVCWRPAFWRRCGRLMSPRGSAGA
jgi:hypothetical protein